MNSIIAMAAHLYAPVSTRAYFKAANLRLQAQCPVSVKHDAKLPTSTE